MTRAIAALVAMLFAAVAPAVARAADDATARARSHYEVGVKLFEAGNHEQALIEFKRANDIKSRPAAVFMMAQCEYVIGRLKDARAHYEEYRTQVGKEGEFYELANDRITSIDKRPSTFAINTVPDEATVSISPEGDAGKVVVTGLAPNNFSVPRGRWRVDVTKRNHQGETRIVEIDIAETKPLFFKLEPIPARLEIETIPASATLYINGNRARNPYRQDIDPGHVELFAEALDHQPKTLDLTLEPGERRLLTGNERLRLTYVQRSGRPELLVASSLIGGVLGAGAVAAAIGKDIDDQNVSSVLLVTGGAIAGGVAGAVISTPLVPQYVPDNQAFFILGSTWIGAAEGMGMAFVWRQVTTDNAERSVDCPTGPEPCRPGTGSQVRAAFVGSIPGLAVGLTAGSLLAKKAPNYGRVTLIQSAAAGGMIAGALTQVALQWKPYGAGWDYTGVRTTGTQDNVTGGRSTDPPYGPCVAGNECVFRQSSIFDLAPGALIGLNVGIVAGLLGAYLPDQSKYGASGKRILLIDLAAGAGALAAGVGACVALSETCLRAAQPSDRDRAIAAGAALVGGGLGLVGGWLLTKDVDEGRDASGRPPAPASIPIATFAPLPDGKGGTVPGFAAMGFF
jgi:hypothetical protein